MKQVFLSWSFTNTFFRQDASVFLKLLNVLLFCCFCCSDGCWLHISIWVSEQTDHQGHQEKQSFGDCSPFLKNFCCHLCNLFFFLHHNICNSLFNVIWDLSPSFCLTQIVPFSSLEPGGCHHWAQLFGSTRRRTQYFWRHRHQRCKVFHREPPRSLWKGGLEPTTCCQRSLLVRWKRFQIFERLWLPPV